MTRRPESGSTPISCTCQPRSVSPAVRVWVISAMGAGFSVAHRLGAPGKPVALADVLVATDREDAEGHRDDARVLLPTSGAD